jgi:hypothetical protein
MHKITSLEGIGVLHLNGDLIGRANYLISINQDDDGKKLAFGSMLVNARVLGLINNGVGSFTLELEKNSGTIDVILGDIIENSVSFDISGPIPGHG